MFALNLQRHSPFASLEWKDVFCGTLLNFCMSLPEICWKHNQIIIVFYCVFQHTHTLSNLYDLCFQISMNQKRKNPTFSYSYNPQDMKGKLTNTRTEIIVDPTPPQRSTHGELMNFTHKNLLRTHILDFKSRKTVYQFFEKTLDDWVQSKKKTRNT
jgi:hypothetical protein